MAQMGRLKTNGVTLKEHEMVTVNLLIMRGFNIELIPKSNLAGIHTADILIDGVCWEIKAPKGKGSSLMQNNLRKAAIQSPNIIIDLYRTKRDQRRCLRELEKQFNLMPKITCLKIITKRRKIIDFTK